jgi:DNA primase
MSVTDEIKSKIDAVDLIGESVQLKRSGKNYTGFCPFHPNTRTPAFVVFPETGTWRCFGQCNTGGDIFSFLMKKEGWDFSEALRYLAGRTGVQLRPQTPEEQKRAEEYESLRELLEDAVTFYRHNLLNSPAGKRALEYLRQKRALTDETMEAFGIGYAPQSWETTSQHLISKGYSVNDLVASGMVGEREDGSIYDRFRHRVMFPIRDFRGRMIGFGARILNPDDLPKFLNSPQTVLFDKSSTLYGLDRARRSIRETDQAVIVEGYLDVIALHQAGYENAVSPMGVALTEQQLQLLKRYSSNILLALDADAAGDQATLRGLELARQTLDREQQLVFDPRGLLGYENRLQADIRVTLLPDGLDPDEVVNRDPAEWQRVVEEAQPVVLHVMHSLAREKDVEDPKTKTEIASRVLPLIEDVPSPIERDAYRQRLARLLRIDEDTLLRMQVTPRRSRKPARSTRRVSSPAGASPPAIRTVPTAASSVQMLEAHCLGVLMRMPEMLYRVDRELQAKNLSRLTVDDFQHSGHQELFRKVQEALDQDIAEPTSYMFNNLDLATMDQVDDLLAGTQEVDINQGKVLEDLLRGVLELRRRSLRQSIEYIRFLMEEAHEQGDMIASQYQKTIKQYLSVLKDIEGALAYYTGDHRLYTRKDLNGRPLL